MSFEDPESIKNIYTKAKETVESGSLPEVSEDELSELHSTILSLKNELGNEIEFTKLSDKINMDFEKITSGILKLITEKKIVGIINDKETADKSDDILILRDERYLDKFEQYEIK